MNHSTARAREGSDPKPPNGAAPAAGSTTLFGAEQIPAELKVTKELKKFGNLLLEKYRLSRKPDLDNLLVRFQAHYAKRNEPIPVKWDAVFRGWMVTEFERAAEAETQTGTRTTHVTI